MSEKTDHELNAIKSILGVLEPLDTEARQRVITYVFQRLNLPITLKTRVSLSDSSSLETSLANEHLIVQSQMGVDIRTLKEQKSPNSASEMAAIVAFYLAEYVPLDERKNTIDKDDIVKYFKQAKYPLPRAIRQTLPNAARSGFFDITGGGRYRLSPVGYNLVVHGLPTKRKTKQ
jgi:hypothetical protein